MILTIFRLAATFGLVACELAYVLVGSGALWCLLVRVWR